MAGPLITASVVIWVAAMWAGWSLVFSAGATGVVDAQSGQPADAWSRIYDAGFTLFTLGVGDYRPNGAFWQMLTALCAADGLLTITLSVTYFVPVVSAATRKRQIAASISRSNSASVSRFNSKESELKPLWVVLKTQSLLRAKAVAAADGRQQEQGNRCYVSIN